MFPCSLRPGFPGLWLFFSRVSPIPFWGWVRPFLGVVPGVFWPFFPSSYSVPGLPGLISCCICLRVLSTRLVARLISQSFSLGDRPLWPAMVNPTLRPWIRRLVRQALHRPHGSLAVRLKYKKKTYLTGEVL